MDTKHIFNIYFTPRNASVGIENAHIFDIRPIYWTTMIIPGNALLQGSVSWTATGHLIVSGSANYENNTGTIVYSTQYYSGSISITSTTSLSATGAGNPWEWDVS